MGHFLRTEEIAGGEQHYHYTAIDQSSLTQKCHEALIGFGYRVVGQDGGMVLYEKGSFTKRILFGAFCNYYKFALFVQPTANAEVRVVLRDKSAALFGGLIGLRQVKKERERLLALLQNI